jgi:hypothetical protein
MINCQESVKNLEHNNTSLGYKRILRKSIQRTIQMEAWCVYSICVKGLNPPNETIPLNQKGTVFLYLCAMEKEIKNTTFQKFQFLTLCFYYL